MKKNKAKRIAHAVIAHAVTAHAVFCLSRPAWPLPVTVNGQVSAGMHRSHSVLSCLKSMALFLVEKYSLVVPNSFFPIKKVGVHNEKVNYV